MNFHPLSLKNEQQQSSFLAVYQLVEKKEEEKYSHIHIFLT